MTTIQHMRGAEPFFHQGNRVGCLLLHGFTGTPNEMRGLGTHLHSQGYTVLGPALAGHATRIEDMLPTRWDDWYLTASDAYDQLSQICDEIFPIGLSLGAMLALHLAAHRRVSGVVGLATPASVSNWKLVPFKLLPPLFRIFPTIKKNLARSDAQDPNLDARHLRYMAYPTLAAASMIRDFFPHVMVDLRDVRAPALLIQGHCDRVVPRNAMDTLHSKIGSREKEIIWLESCGHQVLEDYGKDQAFQLILQFVRRHSPTARSSDSIALPPSLVAQPVRDPAH